MFWGSLDWKGVCYTPKFRTELGGDRELVVVDLISKDELSWNHSEIQHKIH